MTDEKKLHIPGVGSIKVHEPKPEDKMVVGCIKFWRFIWHAKIGHMKQIQIRAVMFQDSSFWCAQCLEHDVAVQARSVDELVVALADTLAAYVELATAEGREPFADLPPAPEEFEDMFRRAHEFRARR